MTKGIIAVLALLALSLATIGGRRPGNSIEVQAFESSSASTSHEQSSPDPKAVIWEYKVLSGTAAVVGRVTGTNSYPVSTEEEINRLAAQGYVVESFQTCCSSVRGGGSGLTFPDSPATVVLLKRMRK